MKKYKLLGADGKEYYSDTPGLLGGNSKLKIYGRLDCPSALSTIKRFRGVMSNPVYSLPMKRQPLPSVIVHVEIVCGRSTGNI